MTPLDPTARSMELFDQGIDSIRLSLATPYGHDRIVAVAMRNGESVINTDGASVEEAITALHRCYMRAYVEFGDPHHDEDGVYVTE